MNHIHNKELCEEIGIHNGQVRAFPLYKNLWWSFHHDRESFGYGDIGREDIEKIYEFLSKEENSRLVFTGWNEHHGTEWQQTDQPIVRISFGSGLTRPFNASLDHRFGLAGPG